MYKKTFEVSLGNISEQTLAIFGKLEPFLKDTIRTWIFLKDIDNNYSKFIQARNEVFDRNGLIPGNHFIASTCVGRPDSYFNPGELVHLDALIVPNLNHDKIEYMSEYSLMPNTSDYGVRFERGTIYKSDEYTYYIISGTASIDNAGNIKFLRDLKNQTIQAIKNIDGLLYKYGQTIKNTKEIKGYVRYPDDIPIVDEICKDILPNIRFKIIEGKICRPEWLVEFETTIIVKGQ